MNNYVQAAGRSMTVKTENEENSCGEKTTFKPKFEIEQHDDDRDSGDDDEDRDNGDDDDEDRDNNDDGEDRDNDDKNKDDDDNDEDIDDSDDDEEEIMMMTMKIFMMTMMMKIDLRRRKTFYDGKCEKKMFLIQFE